MSSRPCKEIWVVGAGRWRNPDEDLPDDCETRRAEYYDKLNKPRDTKVFTAQLATGVPAITTAPTTGCSGPPRSSPACPPWRSSSRCRVARRA